MEGTTPKAEELEDAVLGAILNTGKYVDHIMSDFKRALFYSEANKLVADVIIELYTENSGIDLLIVVDRLRRKGTLEKVGGAMYVSKLTMRVVSDAHLKEHIHILQEMAIKRGSIIVGQELINKAFDGNVDAFDLVSDSVIKLEAIIKDNVTYDVEQVGSVHKRIIAESIQVAQHGGKSGIPSGLRMLDNTTNGWQKSDLIIIAGRPAMGKSSVGIALITNPALENKIPTALFTLEMSSEQVVARIQSGLSSINVSRIVKKQLNFQEIDHISNSCVALRDAPIFIDDTPAISLLELKTKARKLVKDNKVELIVIDYLQLMKSGRDLMSREQEVAEISKGLKSLSKELDIPIIALSQLSRGVEARTDKKPMLQDLRESGSIEQDADMVIFCYRPEYYKQDNYELNGNNIDTNGLFMLLVSKHRNGELGEIPLLFIHNQAMITNHTYGINTPTQYITTSATEVLKRKEQIIEVEDDLIF